MFNMKKWLRCEEGEKLQSKAELTPFPVPPPMS